MIVMGLILGAGLAERVRAQGTISGDANGDCKVDGVDFVVVFNNYGKPTGGGATQGDFSGDGKVDGVDYVILFNHYGQVCQGTPVPTATPTPTPTPVGPTPTPPPIVTGQGIWISSSEIAKLPTSGSAWNAVLSAANGSWGTARLNDNNSMHDVYTLAGALVAVRTGDSTMRAKTIAGLRSAMSSLISRTLELARGLQTYIIAADIIGYHDTGFENWVRDITFARPVPGRDGSGLYNNALTDSTNWGGHERASAIAAALYLRDSRIGELVRAYQEYIGENVSPKTLIYRGTNWQADQNNKAGVNRVGARIQGQDVSGVIPEDWRRGSEFNWPPTLSGYMWEGVQGFTVSAVLLHRAGLVPFTSGNNVLSRVLHQLMDPLNPPNPGINDQPTGDDTWIPWVVNYYAGTNFRTTAANPGKNMGWTDWTHSR
ncbi:MAG: hypothetical protein UX52_C0009G0014 [Candidatus Amesbacteria bacterium GW2011_GWA1_46_35]|uniref:Dockerin domain-containing protein n=1 Tax=Candidatus Amesbacteria bacterium GW2011_GWC2_45_19 TaxID=1618366 RepID=A0A0G1Q0N6_9BACT|nr:MAG: hypothetical protein UX05_C0015G0011 [Candidatus Amesbacteria bacterium GW2011_GWC2_45_19]KKU38207.1 MAG: hypothetical protein UX52_C0009G0014 [Candidatus Amesbacteria bacterium GW2011_GWA1_46_35]KKU68168.1 MAG: hypothetical protein UX93_C0010G0023 [Microgenomates group bacterium GW2011_GWC1_47_20]